MSKADSLKVSGVIIEVLGNSMFRVKLDNEHMLIAHLGGKLRKNNIRIVLGDAVDVEVSPYDLSKGRLVYRK